jgi:D-cysteine desulfhydrase
MLPLFENYKLLGKKLPYVSLGDFPTPVQKLDQLGKQLGLSDLFIKRDDLTGKVYGGNKVRKLEFILGDALRRGAKEVMTFGTAGSNHALATAIYAKQLGLKSISMLIPQPNADYVQHNLLFSYHHGAELHLYSPNRFFKGTADPSVVYQLLRHSLKQGQLPHVIPMGGSSPLGAVGYVNAAFELHGQIVKGEMPEPDCIYIASGSMGTAAGLILGIRALSMKTKVVAVRVNSEKFVNVKRLIKLIYRTNSLLSSMDASFPHFDFQESDMEIRQGFFGTQYALSTEAGLEAISLMNRFGNIKLEGTYTGKTFAALIDDTKKTSLKNKVVLFWNTYNSGDFSETIAAIDYHRLPRNFHCYFEQAVRPIEREQ